MQEFEHANEIANLPIRLLDFQLLANKLSNVIVVMSINTDHAYSPDDTNSLLAIQDTYMQYQFGYCIYTFCTACRGLVSLGACLKMYAYVT